MVLQCSLFSQTYSNYAKEAAEYYDWQYHEIEGSLSLIERMIAGEWNEEDFLILEPGESAFASSDEDILGKYEVTKE